uniref:UDP-glycosyltransferase 91A1-like n=1 Tax=Nicotiana tabacum TaxID=4097 RepID=A0A1S4A650_TOBAC|nr:PREDICTED: UDP-glycosyltransferase 91A1-like [Nicotiana tabacum]
MSKSDVHVVMLPWSAFGHLIPFFNLSISLAKVGGIHVSFISTSRNIKRLPKVPPNLAHLVKLVEFPMPTLDDKSLLPEDVEATSDLPNYLEQLQYLKAAYDLLQEPIEQFIADKKPDWIIVDFAQYWIVEFAETRDIPLIYFSIFPAAAVGFSIAASATDKSVVESFTSPASEMLQVPSSTLSMAIRGCQEFDGEYLDAVHKVINKPAIPVGLLPPAETSRNCSFNYEDDDQSILWQEMFKWLDQQKPMSVLFVGFGSEMEPSKDQVDEIAYGLELSGLSFIWILQKSSWMINSDPLPTSFGLRRGEKLGVVHIGWAPQKEILAHPCIGFTLNHGGWGSVAESLQHGHVLVLLPLMYDQGLNARMLVEKGLGVEVERNEEDGSFTRNDISNALTYAMVSKESEELRARTTKATSIFGDRKLHDSYIASFIEYLKTNRNKSVP